jgi:hypothetical protein
MWSFPNFRYEKGIEKGIEDGELRKSLEITRRMRDFGDSLEKISIVTGRTELQLKENGIL